MTTRFIIIYRSLFLLTVDCKYVFKFTFLSADEIVHKKTGLESTVRKVDCISLTSTLSFFKFPISDKKYTLSPTVDCKHLRVDS